MQKSLLNSRIYLVSPCTLVKSPKIVQPNVRKKYPKNCLVILNFALIFVKTSTEISYEPKSFIIFCHWLLSSLECLSPAFISTKQGLLFPHCVFFDEFPRRIHSALKSEKSAKNSWNHFSPKKSAKSAIWREKKNSKTLII